MRKTEALGILAAHKSELVEYHVQSLSIFGSVARDEARAESDVDILVEFDRPVGLFTFLGLQLRLEEILGRPVDLATIDSIRPTMREAVLRGAVHAT